jgi:O-antigen ligase
LIPILLASPAGPALNAAFDRTFSEERAARNRTSGRSDQWVVAWAALQEDAGSLIWGHGPGSGPRVYARKSWELPSIEFQTGNEMSLHSFYMQLAVETGLLGSILYAVLIGAIGGRVVRGLRGDLLPLLAFGGYLLIAATVSGTDTASGMYLGIGLLGAAAKGAAPSAWTAPNPRRGG